MFDLAELQSFSHAEIAEMLDMKPVTVRGHLFKARRKLRQRILAESPRILEDGC
ncbi:MAG: RNA polymerase sigma factor [Longimicrobiales bacterium]